MGTQTVPHVPVLLEPLLEIIAPVRGTWLDGTFGGGGHTRGLLQAGAERVIAMDRDPSALAAAEVWARKFGDRIEMRLGRFSRMDGYASDINGVVLDLGVSSIQLGQAERGFSFQLDGPLDMRMSQEGPSAADIVAKAPESELASIFAGYGEEQASRRIARSVVQARQKVPIAGTRQLAEIIAGCLPRARTGKIHPATRCFQALRIAVNGEFDELHQGLMAAERVLQPGGKLAVITFHSIEDRIVKRFLNLRGGRAGRGSRHAPERRTCSPRFEILSRKGIRPDAAELRMNPRARSARLRVGQRTDAPAGKIDAARLGVPVPGTDKGRRG